MRAAQYRRNPKAAVYFCDGASFEGLMLRGTMEVLEDAASRRLIWREGDTEYYPQSVAHPDSSVLPFTAVAARYYSNFPSANIDLK